MFLQHSQPVGENLLELSLEAYNENWIFVSNEVKLSSRTNPLQSSENLLDSSENLFKSSENVLNSKNSFKTFIITPHYKKIGK